LSAGRGVKRRWLAAHIFLAFLCVGAPSAFASSAPIDAAQIETWQRAPLHIKGGSGDTAFHVEIAADAYTQRHGLMDRETLSKDSGMLFLFGMDARRSFWMHNTLIPLDMIFIDAQGTIVAIHENAEPRSNEIISPVEFAASVLEINGGLVRTLGIRVGDTVEHPALTAVADGLQ